LTIEKRNLPIKRLSSSTGLYIFNFSFILGAPPYIFKAYRELNKATFAIPALREYQILACSSSDVKAVYESPEETLSFHVAMTDVGKVSRYIFYQKPDFNAALEA
jgi:hypothetical protein